jgi:hypothetical protein
MIVLLPQTEQRHRSANGVAGATQSQWASGCLIMCHPSFLVGEQNKYSGNNHQGNRETDNERNKRMPTALEPSGSSALLRCAEAKPEWKIAHQRLPIHDPCLGLSGGSES